MVAVDPITIRAATTGYLVKGKPVTITQFSSLDFCRGDFIAVVGKNGSGKSTFLRSICGLLPLVSGEILVEGVPVNSGTAGALAKKISVVLTEKVGGFNLKVKDVVANGQMPYTDAFHRLTAANQEKIDDAMRRCGVDSFAGKLISELSDGMFQKTMIARAVAQDTDTMLLDEPTAYLDYASRFELFIFLRKEAEERNKCVLISTHELDLALRYCTKVLVIANGSARLLTVSEARSDDWVQETAGGYLR